MFKSLFMAKTKKKRSTAKKRTTKKSTAKKGLTAKQKSAVVKKAGNAASLAARKAVRAAL